MFGIYGIAADSKKLKRKRRETAFDEMASRMDATYFNNLVVATEYLNIGIVRRNNHENKDIAIKSIAPNYVIAFSGYGKLKGRNGFLWAKEMIDVVKDHYEKKGAASLKKIEGSFECILCKDEHFFLVSDRFGSKKQFISEHGDFIIFAPDAGQIIAADLLPKAKNLDAAAQLLISGFFLDDSTLDKYINRFPFATILSTNLKRSNQSKRQRYWHPPACNGYITKIDADLEKAFSDVMKTAIWDLHELSSKTILPLSGGLDSRAIACFLSQKQKLTTLTYDFGDEVNIARKVAKVLGAEHTIIKNSDLRRESYATHLEQLISRQYFQAVINQYFYAPLFYRYLARHGEFEGIYDGVFMDILFSAPYVYRNFNYNKAKSIYGRGTQIYSNLAQKLTPAFLENIMRRQYDTICSNAGSFGEFDGYGLSQLFYISGRLRRYVCETYHSRENYGYVFKPGFDYRLVDFGFNLDHSLRKGVLYQHMLKRNFPDVMRILFKDSYGNRKKTGTEKIRSSYKKLRMKISNLSKGMIGYTPFQVDHYFLKLKRCNDLKGYFFNNNHIPEFFSDKELQNIFNASKRKFYLFNLVQRIQVVNNFYGKFQY